MRAFMALCCAVALLVGCDEASSTTDAGGQDAGRDAGSDVSADAGPACSCSGVSTCCDGCTSRNPGVACDDGLSCSATSVCSAGACVLETPTCPVATPECQTRTCDETTGCGPVTSIRNGFDCDDDSATTYDDVCVAGACIGTAYACTVNNGGCVGTEVCVGHDPAPNTCECASGRYQVTASTVLDTMSGRTWQRAQAPSTYTFAQAETYCAGLALAGGGWRLPTSDELVAVHFGNIAQAPQYIDACAFPSTSQQAFRTSTAWTESGYHRLIDFGGCCGAPGGLDTAAYYVRCVR